MRVPILLACIALPLHAVHSATLSDADREALLENLDKLQDDADSKVDAKLRIAIAAFRNGLGNDESTMELYMNCLEKVNFTDQQKKAADFREWKRKESDKLSDTGLKLALRIQLRWLILTLQASSENADPTKLAGEAMQIVDSVFQNAEKLNNQEGILGQSVLSSVFARAYDINHLKLEKWPASPIQLENIYGDLIMPPLRSASHLPQLRSTWIKRIQQETAKAEYWQGGGGGRNRDPREGPKRVAPTDSTQSPEYVRFIENELPKLQWDMEVDLFRSGDQNGASVRMLSHLQKYLSHPSAKEWSQQFRALLIPNPNTPAGVPKPSSADTSP